ncbi:MAG: D-alanine--D-alanine ligase [Elusimicrobia bacterium]|nr:D-alanine--D-alanine ligase [Elusimicrobiota bacterium]
MTLSAGERRALAWLKRRRPAVLKGGWSKERSISLKTGAAVEAAFHRLGVKFRSIDVDRRVFDRLKKSRVNFCFIALHGEFGEDGKIQEGLELLEIPYTGSGPLASALAMDKIASKRLFVKARVPTPPWHTVTEEEFADDPRSTLASAAALLRMGPVFVKPYDQGSAIGISRVDRRSGLARALRACFRLSSTALIERFIDGRELTVGILGDKAMPIVEIVPVHRFYDFHSKYAPGGSRHLVPADLPRPVARRVSAAALGAFRAVRCEAYGRVDVLIDRRGRPWVLEVNTIPGMTATSLLPDAARAAGIDFDRLVVKIIQYSLDRRRTG